MCGRFTLKTAAALWVQELFPGLQILDMPEISARYNIAPTQPILTIMQSEADLPQHSAHATFTRWGLIPPWSEDAAIGAKMINARSETVTEKPSFKKPFTKQRCIIVADGYYEWPKGQGDGKQPYYIHRPNRQPFLMAGIWETNKRIQPHQPTITSSLLTIQANARINEYHDRMPVILQPDDAPRWLDPTLQKNEDVSDLLRSMHDDYFVLEPVSRYVNNARHEGPECIEVVRTLF